MLTILFTILHVLVSLFLILVVLAQQGKGQDLASAFGGGGSQTAFGARGTATLLSKITAGAAALFVVTSLTLSYLRPAVGGGGNTVIPESAPPASAPAETGEGTQAEEPPAESEVEPPAGERDDDEAASSGSEGEGGDAAESTGEGEGGGGETETPPPPQP